MKMSSLGDILQAFNVLDLLRSAFPDALIDWVVEEGLAPLVSAHPYVNEALLVNFKELKGGWWRRALWKKLFGFLKKIRRRRYDLVFDLQGNCKSGIVTWISRAKVKVGFGIGCVREKPNILSTHVRFEVCKKKNIREQYLELVSRFLQERLGIKRLDFTGAGIALKIVEEERERVGLIFGQSALQRRPRIMVCPGSQWVNKKIPLKILSEFLGRLQEKLDCSFLFVWGSDREKKECEELHMLFAETSIILEKLSFPALQNVMNGVDVVVAVDSSALHLCSITKTPSFSVFGPSSPSIFKPPGLRHFAMQGECPYGKKFDKTCPLLRTCVTGACMKNLQASEIADAFFNWHYTIHKK